MEEKVLNVKLINKLLERKNNFKVGEKEEFTYKNYNGNDWSFVLRREEEQYYPFIFALEGNKLGTNEMLSRRYTSIEQAILHIVNCFNENSEIQNKYSDLQDYILNADERENPRKYNYMMLDRLRTDCDYFLDNGNGFLGHLYYKDVNKHIEEMKKIYGSFSEQEKPEWISLQDIENYKEKMNEKLKERNFDKQDYKYIIKCDLSSDEAIYMNQYLLVQNVNVPSDYDVDLVGDCCFNCDFEILDPKIVAKVYSLEDVKKFCEINKIEIEKNIDKEGNLIIGASKTQIISSDMNRYDKERELRSDYHKLLNENMDINIELGESEENEL